MMNEKGQTIAHGIVFQPSLTVLAIVPTVLNGNRNKGWESSLGILGKGKIIKRKTHQVEAVWPVMHHQKGCLLSISIGCRNIYENAALLSYRLAIWFQGSIIPLKVTTFGQGHGEFEQPSLGIASIGQVRVEGVFWTNDIIAITFTGNRLSLSARSCTPLTLSRVIAGTLIQVFLDPSSQGRASSTITPGQRAQIACLKSRRFAPVIWKRLQHLCMHAN